MAKNKAKRFFSGLGSLALAAVAILAVFVMAVLLETPGKQEKESFVVQQEETVSPMQAGSGSDAGEMARLFGAPLPVLRGQTAVCEARNTQHDGQTVRMVTLRYAGVEITAVRPASAAPLLLRSGLTLQLRSDLTALNLPATLASRGSEYCLYFSDEYAAYSIYAPAATEDSFLSVLALVEQQK